MKRIVPAYDGSEQLKLALEAAAREFDAELIVIGTRGHGAFRRMLLGSTSRGVAGRAPCSVLVVH